MNKLVEYMETHHAPLMTAYESVRVETVMDDTAWTREEIFEMAMEEWSKKVEEYGLKVKLWGISYGTSEPPVIVIKGTPENFLKIAPPNMPYVNTRTNMVAVF